MFVTKRLTMKTLHHIFVFSILFISGCGNLSPRQDQKINNENGKIDDITNNQNGILAEIGKLKNQLDIQNSTLDKIQQGMINVQSNNENSGVQILSGNGGLLIAFFGFTCLSVIALHYQRKAKINGDTANLLAKQIVELNDYNLENSVFIAALNTPLEENVLRIMKKVKI